MFIYYVYEFRNLEIKYCDNYSIASIGYLYGNLMFFEAWQTWLLWTVIVQKRAPWRILLFCWIAKTACRFELKFSFLSELLYIFRRISITKHLTAICSHEGWTEVRDILHSKLQAKEQLYSVWLKCEWMTHLLNRSCLFSTRRLTNLGPAEKGTKAWGDLLAEFSGRNLNGSYTCGQHNILNTHTDYKYRL